MNSWELRELEGLPDAIAALEAQQAELAGKLADGSLYRTRRRRWSGSTAN